MSYFLASSKLILNTEVEIIGDEAAHILLARRIKKGENIKLQGSEGKRFEAEVVEVSKKSLKVKIIHELKVPQELGKKITIFQSVVSEKALDFIFQKATELGATKIVLFNSANTATKLTVDQYGKKIERWTKILWESAKQCDRAKIPELAFLNNPGDVLKDAAHYDQFIILDGQGTNIKSLNLKFNSIGIVVGPEGGLAPLELDQLKTIPSSTVVSISPFTLRAETAAIASLAIIQN